MSKPVTFEAWAVVVTRGKKHVKWMPCGEAMIWHKDYKPSENNTCLPAEKIVKVRITMEVVDEEVPRANR